MHVGLVALDHGDIAANRTLDGEIVVDGPVIVRSGATVTSSTGSLTINFAAFDAPSLRRLELDQANVTLASLVACADVRRLPYQLTRGSGEHRWR
jgi:hypothetical protein